jgi:hypothetical protein
MFCCVSSNAICLYQTTYVLVSSFRISLYEKQIKSMQSSFTYHAKVLRSKAASNEYTDKRYCCSSALDKPRFRVVPVFRRKCELKIKRIYTEYPYKSAQRATNNAWLCFRVSPRFPCSAVLHFPVFVLGYSYV